MSNNEKKKFEMKQWQKVLAIVLGSIVVITVALGLIPNKTLARSVFSDYKYVNVYDNNGQLCVITTDSDEEEATEAREYFDDGIDSTSFSWLRGLLEYKIWGYGFDFRTYEETEEEIEYDDYGYPELDDDGNEEYDEEDYEYRYEMLGRDVQSSMLSQVGDGKFVLEFVFANQGEDRKSIKIEGEEVLFSHMYVVIIDTEGLLYSDMELYLVDEDQVYDNEEGYWVSPIGFTADFTTLYENLCEIKEIYTGTDDNGTYGGETEEDTEEDTDTDTEEEVTE